MPPSIAALYDDPELSKSYPFAQRTSRRRSPPPRTRPLTPAYQNVSIVDLPRAVAAGGHQSPRARREVMANEIEDALESKGLVP